MTPPKPESSTTTARGAAAILFLAYAFFLPAWWPGVGLYHGGDSWREVLCHFAGSEMQAGIDLIYTTGPLGFLRQPIYCAQLLWLAIAWSLLQALTLASIYLRFFTTAPRRTALAGAGLFLVLPALDGTPGTGLYFGLLVLHLFLEAERPRARLHWSDALVALTLAVGSWIVFTRFVASAAAVGLGAAIYLFRFRRISPVAGLYGVLLVVLWALAGQHPSSLWPYLQNSYDLSRGYGEVMAVDGPQWEIWVALAAFVVVSGGLLALWRLWRPWWVWASLGLGVTGIFWIAFKTSFVRHGRPRATAVAVVLVAIALALWSRRARSPKGGSRGLRAAAALALAASLGVGLVFLGPGTGGGLGLYLRKIPARWARQARGIGEHLRGLPRIDALDQKRAARVREKLALPPIEGPVDWFGWDAGSMVALGVDYRPRPIFQNYVAFTPRLAELNARFFRSEAAPETLLMDLKRISGYPSTLLDARAFLELLASYEVTDNYGPVMRLERKERRPCELTPVFAATRQLGRRIAFDGLQEKTPLWVEVDVLPTLFGKVTAFLFKPDRLALKTEMVDGTTETYRFATAPGRGGFLLSPLLRRNGDFERLSNRGMSGSIRWRAVRAVRIRARSEWGQAQFHRVHVKAYAVTGCIPEKPLP